MPMNPFQYPRSAVERGVDDLALAGRTLHKDAKGLRAVGAWVNRLDKQGTLALSKADELVHRLGFGISVGQVLDFAVKSMQAQLKGIQYENLKKADNQDNVDMERVATIQVEQEYEGTKRLHSARQQEWENEANDEIGDINEDLSELVGDPSIHINEHWIDEEMLCLDLERVHRKLLAFFRGVDAHRSVGGTAADAAAAKRSYEFARALPDQVFTLLERAEGRRAERKKERQGLEKIERRRAEAWKKYKLPENRFLERDQLLREREMLLADVHHIQLVQHRLRRKVEVLGVRMREFYNGREPDEAQENMERADVTFLRERLATLHELASTMLSTTGLHEHLRERPRLGRWKRTASASSDARFAALEKKFPVREDRLPTVHDVEKLLERLALPEDLRHEMYTYIAKNVMGRHVAGMAATNGSDRVDKRIREEAQAALRYQTISPTVLARLYDYLGDYLSDGTEPEVAQEAA